MMSRIMSKLASPPSAAESEARLQALLSSLDDLVIELDENGTYLAVWTNERRATRGAPGGAAGPNSV